MFGNADSIAAVITPTIAGALNALEAAAREPNVKRFVYCSCVAASVSCDRTVRSEVTNQSWNMADFNYAWAPPPYDDERSLSVYASSKMQTEAAVWRWYEVKGPSFALNTGWFSRETFSVGDKTDRLPIQSSLTPFGAVFSILSIRITPSLSHY